MENGIDTRPRKWIVVHNDVVLARIDWTINMNRIFAMLVSQISMDAEEFRPQRIKVGQLRSLAEVSSNNIHKQLADAAQRLVREPIEFRTPDNHYDGYPIFASCSYIRNEGAIEAQFNEKGRPYLLQLRESFTKYKLKKAMKLSSSYAVRFYQIAKMIQRDDGPRSRKIKLDEFRRLFMLGDKYSQHSDLVIHVVDPSVEEVNEKTETKLRVETVRKGDSKYGKPLALRWTVWPADESKSHSLPETSESKDEKNNERKEQKPSDFEIWFGNLDEEGQRKWWAKARELVLKDGRNPDNAGFEGFVQMKLREITKSERS